MSGVFVQGDYRPPLGGVGRALDRRVMHMVAEATMRDLAKRIARALIEV